MDIELDLAQEISKLSGWSRGSKMQAVSVLRQMQSGGQSDAAYRDAHEIWGVATLWW